jgi:hypothetical protein
VMRDGQRFGADTRSERAARSDSHERQLVAGDD